MSSKELVALTAQSLNETGVCIVRHLLGLLILIKKKGLLLFLCKAALKV